MQSTYRRLGELLVSRSAITSLQLSIALADQRVSNRRLGEIVVERGYTTEFEVAACLAYQYGYQVIDLQKFRPTVEALSKLTAEDAICLRALPIEDTEEGLLCAISDPIDVFATDRLAGLTRSRLILKISPESLLIKAIQAAYGLAEDELTPLYPEAEHAPGRFKALQSRQRIGDTALFDAYDTILDRRITLAASPANGEGSSEQYTIVRGAAKVAVDGVAAIYDSIDSGGLRWTVMQRMHGESLERILRTRGPRAIPLAANLLARTAEIVDAMQRSGGSGNWACPTNILMRNNGPLLVPLTAAPTYYTPMATHGDAEMPGSAAAYALGCLLKDCLFGVDSAAHLNIPIAMKDILENCLNQDPTHRYSSAIEVASALRSFNWMALANPHSSTTNQEREELLSSLTDLTTITETKKSSFFGKLFGRKAA